MFSLYLQSVWSVTLELAPWLLFGLLLAGLLHVLVPPDLVRRHLGKPGWLSTFKAVALGVPLPLCSCGVIPAAIGLKKDGASDGAATGFLISTPQTGLDSISVAAAFLGWPFALYKVASALVTGMLGGVLVDLTAPKNVAAPALPATPATLDCAPPVGLAAKGGAIVRYAIDDLLYMIWKWLLVGVLISAAITVLIPPNALQHTVFASPLVAMLATLAIALPLYVCATSSVPIAAALVQAGLPPGAALVFLMAGPASNVATIGAVYRTFGARVLAIYLAVVGGGSMVLGYAFGFILDVAKISTTLTPRHHHGMDAAWNVSTLVAWAAALVLAGLLLRFAARDAAAWWRQRQAPDALPAGAAPAANAEQVLTLGVGGMTCNGCANHARQALSAVPGVRSVAVDLAGARAEIHGTALDLPALHAAIRAAGFQVL